MRLDGECWQLVHDFKKDKLVLLWVGGGPAGAYGGSPTGMRGMETNVQDSHNGVDQKEEINIQPEQNEETRIQKMRRGLGTSGTTLNVPTSKS